MSHEDPFLAAQSDILALLQQCRTSLHSYLRIRSSASSATSPELAEARAELEDTLTDVNADLQDLVDSVKAVEGDPYRYGLDIDEVSRRRKLVSDVGNEIQDMRRRVNQTVEEAERKRSNSLRHPDDFDDRDPLAATDDGYSEWEEQRQMEIMHEQDEALDGVFQTVGNLRAQADTMGRELEEQAELLQDTDNIADRVGDKLAKGMKGIRHVLEKNEGSHPLLQQTALAVNPFIDLPKPPTLPPNYTSLPSTLGPSVLSAAATSSSSDQPAYVTTPAGTFAAHPSNIITQNQSLQKQIQREGEEARKMVEGWESDIRERELQERRRKAPGWLDREERMLQPERVDGGKIANGSNLMDDPIKADDGEDERSASAAHHQRELDDLGVAMDRAFGRSEMG